MHSEKVNNTMISRKSNETTHFKVKKNLEGTILREQSTISNWDLQSRIPIRDKSNTVTKLGSELLRLLWSRLALTWTSSSRFRSPT